MRSIARLCVAAALSSLFAPSALADAGLYLRFAAGAGFVDQDSFGAVDFESGYTGSAAVGYNWFLPENIADLRMELEASYRYNDVDTILSLPADGEAQVFSVMLNGYFDFRTNLPFVPYIGAGLGAAQIRYTDDGAGGLLGSTIDDHDTVFAFQSMVGVNYDLASGMALGLEYRFLETENFTFVDSLGFGFVDNYDNHSALLTLTLGF